MRVGPGALCLVGMTACSSSAPSREKPRSPEEVCDTTREAGACVAAAELYFDGKNGHPLDHARSFRYASAACDKGHAFGCALTGYHHQDGLGTEWAPARAMAAYEKACAGGAGVGCYNLASMYFGGHGVTADEARAEAYKAKAKAAWQAACAGAEPRWCTNVAYLLREQQGVDREKCLELDQRSCAHGTLVGCTEAVRDRFALGRIEVTPMLAELEKLCSEGEPTGCTHAGIALIQGGEGITTDPPRGLKLIARGCDNGDKYACQLAAVEYTTGQLVTADAAAADRYWRRACEYGAGVACSAMARSEAQRNRFAEAAGFARRACQMGEGESCGGLSLLYFDGQGVAKSEVEGVRWATEACRMGYVPACGVLIVRDRELPVPPAMSERIYRDACAGKVEQACERLKRAAGVSPGGGGGAER